MNFPLSIRLIQNLNSSAVREGSAEVKTSNRFHLAMMITSSAIILFFLMGSWVTDLHVRGLSGQLLGVLVLTAMVIPLPAYWHEKGRLDLRDAALTIPWVFLLSVLLPLPFLVAARLHMPMQDTSLGVVDGAFGFNTAYFVDWASHHWVGSILNRTYTLLPSYMLMASLAPALSGKPQARHFLLANVFALSATGVCFIFLPAIGPWVGHRFQASVAQQLCEAQLRGLRQTEPYSFSFLLQATGFVCFPSCHVIWAFLSGSALWGFRYLRVPATILSLMIALSTLTTGWHYATDAFAGLVIATGSLILARRFNP